MHDHNISKINSASFANYIADCRQLIAERRTDLHQAHADVKQIIDANSPFEGYPPDFNQHPHSPSSRKRARFGALLIHGLLASPFAMRDISQVLEKAQVQTRAILLPGHGTRPADLLTVSHREWIASVRFGVESLLQEVDHLILVGYSIGATLALHEALQNTHIAGLVLLTPAIKIKVPYSVIVSWHYLLQKLTPNKQWIYRDEEIDYAKYTSLSYNAVKQVLNLINLLNRKRATLPQCPVLMIGSEEDETVCNQSAVNYFNKFPNPHNQLLLYSANKQQDANKKITIRHADFPSMHIKHLSHIGAPFSPNNTHYGQQGDFAYASRIETPFPSYYGAYNQFEIDFYTQLFKLGFIKNKRTTATYNPDFNYMANRIATFITQVCDTTATTA